jgi:serine/threonine-protein kinase
MGSVWEAEHVELHSRFALKLMQPGAAARSGALARFAREARALAALRSRHVVTVLDYGVDDADAYLVMQCLQGETLEARLARLAPLEPAESLWILSDIAQGLAHAHDGNLVHRDVKPANVFLTRDDDRELAVLLDFGVAKVFEEGSEHTSTAAGSMLGTPAYMSPEQINGERDLDARSDVWSYGIIAYQCVVGERPFEGRTITELVLKICGGAAPLPSSRAPVPEGFDDWFATATARDRASRFANIRVASERLKECLRSGRFARSGPSALVEATLPGDSESSALAPSARGLARASEPARSADSETTLQTAPTRSGRSAQIAVAFAVAALMALGVALWVYAPASSKPGGTAAALAPIAARDVLSAERQSAPTEAPRSSASQGTPTVTPALSSSVAPEAVSSGRPGPPTPTVRRAPAAAKTSDVERRLGF